MKFSKNSSVVAIALLFLTTIIIAITCYFIADEEHDSSRLAIWKHYRTHDILTKKDSVQADSLLISFLIELDQVPNRELETLLHDFLQVVSQRPKNLAYFSEALKSQLYQPNSVLYNEKYYGYVVDFLVKFKGTSKEEKLRLTLIKNNISKNIPGVKAPDFTFTTMDGEKMHLYKQTEAYKLVLFFDPSCPHCFEIIQELKNSQTLENLVNEKVVDVLTICPFDSKELWMDYKPYLSSLWLNGINDDQTILTQQLYSFRAYPTIYVLDKHNVVLLKDPTWQETLDFFVHLPK